MTMTIPFSDRLSEQWLIERTHHALLRDGRELSVLSLTEAMKQLIDFSVPISLQSWKSKLAQMLPVKESTNFSVPLSTWGEISQEEAQALYRQGMPILLFAEHAWSHSSTATTAWRPNHNMSAIIAGDAQVHSAMVSENEYAVCYLDLERGAFSNDAWRNWFPSDGPELLASSTSDAITFFTPTVQFPYNTHYTVIAAEGQVHEYKNRDGAIEGFQALPVQQMSQESAMPAVSPQFCYYHDVTCPDGIYRLEFFGPHMSEPGYLVKREIEGSKGTV